MKKEIIPGHNGYEIPGLNNLIDGESLAVIISHGFGSSKESSTAKTVSDGLAKCGIGTYCFDFPAHGESPVDGEIFRIENCSGDLAAVEAHVQQLDPKAEVAYFSSSFGAYINLIYLATRKHAGNRSFLRCAAVDMPGLFKRATTPEHYAQLEKQGFVILDNGYTRPLKLTQAFMDDLEKYDAFKLYRPGMAELAMIHGTADEIAPLEDARRFAKQSDAKLTEVKGSDHRFLIPGGMEQVVKAAIRFFTGYSKQPLSYTKQQIPETEVSL